MEVIAISRCGSGGVLVRRPATGYVALALSLLRARIEVSYRALVGTYIALMHQHFPVTGNAWIPTPTIGSSGFGWTSLSPATRNHSLVRLTRQSPGRVTQMSMRIAIARPILRHEI